VDIRRSEKHSFDFDSDLSLAKRSSVWHCELDAKNETDNLASFKLPYPNPGAKSHDNSFCEHAINYLSRSSKSLKRVDPIPKPPTRV